jgi:acyl carrier protein
MSSTEFDVQSIKQSLAQSANVLIEALGDDKPLADVGVDSLAIVEMLMDLEDRYGVRLSQDDLRKARTVGDLVRLCTQA